VARGPLHQRRALGSTAVENAKLPGQRAIGGVNAAAGARILRRSDALRTSPIIQQIRCAHQAAGVGMVELGLAEQRGGDLLDDAAFEHHEHPVGDAAHEAEVVADEQVGEPLAFELLEQVDDLELDRRVEAAGRLVGDDEAGLGGEDAGEAGAAFFAAREARRALVGAGQEADAGQQLVGVGLRPAASSSGRCRRSDSSSISRTLILGCRLAVWFWKTIWKARRRSRSAPRSMLKRSSPSKSTRPSSTVVSRVSTLPSVVLPEPDSPMSATTSPGWMSRLDVVERDGRLAAAEEVAGAEALDEVAGAEDRLLGAGGFGAGGVGAGGVGRWLGVGRHAATSSPPGSEAAESSIAV
jgi:hypothetical protein